MSTPSAASDGRRSAWQVGLACRPRRREGCPARRSASAVLALLLRTAMSHGSAAPATVGCDFHRRWSRRCQAFERTSLGRSTRHLSPARAYGSSYSETRPCRRGCAPSARGDVTRSPHGRRDGVDAIPGHRDAVDAAARTGLRASSGRRDVSRPRSSTRGVRHRRDFRRGVRDFD